MNWDKLKAFYYVSKIGSVSHAADIMGLTQSSVSRQIMNLEKELGVKLFDRTTKKLTLNYKGKLLFDTVCKVFREIESIEHLIQEEEKTPKGPLRISTTVGLCSTWLMNYIPGFLEEYPDIELSIVGVDDPINLHMQEADVGIQGYQQDEPGLIQEYLMTFHFGLFAHKKYLEKFGTPKDVKDLDYHRLIAFTSGVFYPYGNIHWHLKAGCSLGEIRKPYLMVNSAQAIHQAVEAGLGIASLSKEHKDSKFYNNNDIIEVLPDVEGIKTDIYYIYPKQIANSERVKAFESYLKKHIKINHPNHSGSL